MIVTPKVWHFVCTTAHPLGCEQNIKDQIDTISVKGTHDNGPKRVLIIGASTGYGLAARIAAAFGFGAATLGVFFEKPSRKTRVASAGWYNSAAFEKLSQKAGLWSRSINGDAFSNDARNCVIDLIKHEMDGPIDLVIYSLASPVRCLPDSGMIIRSSLKPIGSPYHGKTIDTDCDELIDIDIAPATQQEINDTIRVMGGEDWKIWVEALHQANVLAKQAVNIAFSYIGGEMTWPIYWNGTIGRAKQHLEETAAELRTQFLTYGLRTHVAVMKSTITQASAAIPVMPLYLSLVSQIMKKKQLHESMIEQQYRLFHEFLYRKDQQLPATDTKSRIRLDLHELREDVQRDCKALLTRVTNQNLAEVTDYLTYKREFLQLFGFERQNLDYHADVDINTQFDCLVL